MKHNRETNPNTFNYLILAKEPKTRIGGKITSLTNGAVYPQQKSYVSLCTTSKWIKDLNNKAEKHDLPVDKHKTIEIITLWFKEILNRILIAKEMTSGIHKCYYFKLESFCTSKEKTQCKDNLQSGKKMHCLFLSQD